MSEVVELTDAQLGQQDFVDDEIQSLICRLANKEEGELEWDIELISIVREAVQEVVCDRLNLMTEMEFYPYIADEEYPCTDLTKKGKVLLDSLTAFLMEMGHGEHDYYGEKVPAEWKAYPLLWSGYCSDREGCVREGGVFGDMTELEGEIREMFACYLKAIRDVVRTELKSRVHVDLTIDSSYEDHTYYVMTCGDIVILKGSCKAWNFSADTPQELAEMMEDDYNTIKNNLRVAIIGERNIVSGKERSK
ncbi:MAG: hypothetical protein WC455_13235 [Dehalococcoidia bacterium]|jgi:hypothetical protein